MAKQEMFQVVGQEKLNRAEHVWYRTGSKWKCVLCGGVTTRTPPAVGHEGSWMPDTYEKLTDAERAKFPYEPPTLK